MHVNPSLSGRAVALAFCSVLALPAAAAAEPSDTTRNGPGPESIAPHYARTDRLTAVVLGLGALHHVDHVVRGNHSGWPFTSSVTPFTYSLAIYPLVGAAYLADAGPLAFVVIDAAGTAGLLLSHSLLEPPRDQYEPWADGSNRLGVTAPMVGRLAQAVSVGLSAGLAAHLISSVLDGREYGFTWTRSASRKNGQLRVGAPVMTPSGGLAWSIVVPL